MKSIACATLIAFSFLAPAEAASQAAPPGAAESSQAVAPAVSSTVSRKLDPGVLDAYAGFYQFGDHAVLTIVHKADSLSAQLTGQPAGDIVAVSNTDFVNEQFGARFTFLLDKSGQATAVVLSQRGQTITMPRVDAAAAHGIEDSTRARVKSQIPATGSEAALRRLIAGVRAGKPNYAEMNSGLADALRIQAPQLQKDLEDWGDIQSMRFLHVGNQGNDIYEVRMENRTTQWSITLTPDGKIESALVRPPQ